MCVWQLWLGEVLPLLALNRFLLMAHQVFSFSFCVYLFVYLTRWPFPLSSFLTRGRQKTTVRRINGLRQVLIRVENNIIVNDWCKSKKIALDKMVFRSDACCNWFMLKYGKRNLKRSHFFPKGFSFLCFQIPIQKTKDRWDTGWRNF